MTIPEPPRPDRPSDPDVPHPEPADSPYAFGKLDALRQLRELFPGSRILFDLDAPSGTNVVTLESPPALIIRTHAPDATARGAA
ncbi:MAG: hypothetical protein J0I11_15635 [Actinobacteria bacterium]|nr:hypothetical protein [Actinomycetota bacterium]